jgi:hypothetical protein
MWLVLSPAPKKRQTEKRTDAQLRNKGCALTYEPLKIMQLINKQPGRETRGSSTD